MANPDRRLPDNAPGPWFVDRTCIDCAVCRWVAPETFAGGDGHSYVARQPAGHAEGRRAAMALIACPTGSIGTLEKEDVAAARGAYPEEIDGGVMFCGYTSEDSFGAASYLIVRPEGNVLVDSPRAAGPLLARIERLGGVRMMFLTHRDDVADHEKLHRRFGCERVIHEADMTRATRDVERKVAGSTPVDLSPGLTMIPTPGHTRGHAVLLWGERYLFTGDHLAWSPDAGRLYAFRDACWYSWDEQVRSMRRLLDHRFEWVLPGHGWRWRAPSAEAMRSELQRCVEWMESTRR